MKKLLLFSLFSLALATATAQHRWWVGGSLLLSHSSSSFDKETDGKKNETESFGNHYMLNPHVGYRLNDRWDIALSLGFDLSKLTSETLLAGKDKFESDHTRIGLSIKPYARYTYARMDKVSLFVDGGLHFSLPVQDPDEDELTFEVGAGLYPGIAYALNDRLGLVAHIGNLSWLYYDRMEGSKGHTFSLELSNELSLGFYVNL